MTLELTPEEKSNIVEQHLKNVLFAEYNAQISLIEANASSAAENTPDGVNAKLVEINKQKVALQNELDAVNALADTANTTPSSTTK